MRRSLTIFGSILLVLSSFCFTADSQETGRTRPSNAKSAQKDIRSLWPWGASSKKKARFALPFTGNADDDGTARKKVQKVAPSQRAQTKASKSTRSPSRTTAPEPPKANLPRGGLSKDGRLSEDDFILPAMTRSGLNGELSPKDRSSNVAQRTDRKSVV